jgi:photolyase PhrII
LRDVKEALRERNIKFVLRVGALQETTQEITENACTVVTDFPYLEEHDQRLKAFVAATPLPVTAIEGNIIVPVKTASDKQEYADLSAYLAWGMIAPAYVLRRLDYYKNDENAKSFLEELLVRRELARNFVFYANPYDQLPALPDWARKTIEDHKPDERDYVYTRKELENGKTHDKAWNECMRQMRERAYLHNHLRMYWGKQILAWTNTPQYALSTLLYLNNKYFLDGNDPNSYANALWVFGLHDRAWQENDVFGKVRIMNRNGLDRKIKVDTLISN